MNTPRSKAIVLCEGKEDRLVFEKVAELAGLSGLKFEDYGGKDKLAPFLQSLKTRPDFVRREFEILAITRDADESYVSAWQSLSDTIIRTLNVKLAEPGTRAGIPSQFPNDPPSQVIAWIVPGRDKTGMIESLCLESVSGQPEFECIESYFKCLAEKTGNADFHPKAKFHAWIVSHTDFKDKDYKMEKAIKEDRFQWSHVAFDELRAFLRGIVS